MSGRSFSKSTKWWPLKGPFVKKRLLSWWTVRSPIHYRQEWPWGQIQIEQHDLSSFSSDSSSQLDVLWHDGNSLGVDGAQVGVFKKTNQVSFGGFLESHDSGRLESKIGLEVLGDFTNQPLEGELSDQELSWFLVSPDFSKSDCFLVGTLWGFLTPPVAGARFSGCLGGQLFSGSLSSGGFSGGLLRSGHCKWWVWVFGFRKARSKDQEY